MNLSLNCTEKYDTTNYKILAGLRAGVGFVSALCCITVICIIILLKKYKVFSQRLILNIAVAALIHSLSYTTARVNYYTVRSIEDKYCNFGGLFNIYGATVELISIWFAAVNIFSVGVCRRNISRCEYLYYIMTYTLPMLWVWIPVWRRAFGTNGGWCDLRSFDDNCTKIKEGSYIGFGMWFIPLYALSIIIVAMLVAVPIRVFYGMQSRDRRHNPVAKAAMAVVCSEIRPLIMYPIIYMLLNTFSLANYIYIAVDPGNPSIVLSYLHVFSSTLRGAFIALVFACNRDTWRRLRARKRQMQYGDKEPSVKEIDTTTLYNDREYSINYGEQDPLLQ